MMGCQRKLNAIESPLTQLFVLTPLPDLTSWLVGCLIPVMGIGGGYIGRGGDAIADACICVTSERFFG